MSLDFQKRRAIERIMSHVIGEDFGLEHLDVILHTCLALCYSDETEKVARAAYGLVKEILHREHQAYVFEREPWKYLLPAPRFRSDIELAILEDRILGHA